MADPNDIAIVGMALRVPGATTPEQFWQNLRLGVEALQTYPDELLRSRGVQVDVLQDARCVALMSSFIASRPELWNEDIGVVADYHL